MMAAIVVFGVGRLRGSLSSDHARSSETSSAIKRRNRARSSGGRFLRRSAARQARQKSRLISRQGTPCRAQYARPSLVDGDDGGGGHILPREGCRLTCAAMRGKYGAFRSAELPLTNERALCGAFRVSGVALGLC